MPKSCEGGLDVLTVGQAARLLQVAARTVARWVDQGMVPGAYRLPGSLDRRLPRAGLREFCAKNGMPVPPALQVEG